MFSNASSPAVDPGSIPSTSPAPLPPGSLGHDDFGNPYITDVAGKAIAPGMTAQAAFAALGGEAVSGSTGTQAPPPNGYNYPVKGTGNPDDVADTKTV